MRSIVIPFLFCLTLWAVALPQADRGPTVSLDAPTPVAPGHMITVTVEGAPAVTESAFFDLGPQIRGLQLYPAVHGVWKGSFAVLPSMVGQHFRAVAHLYDAERKAIPVPPSELTVQVASAPSPQPGVIAETSDGRAAVAFDETVRLDSIVIHTRDQKGKLQPELRNNYLVLPTTFDVDDIVEVTALTIHGEPLTLSGPASTAMVMGTR